MLEVDDIKYYRGLLLELCKLKNETEWVEFKCNNTAPATIGEYISALANSAVLAGKINAYVVWGVNDKTHDIIGTTFRPSQQKKGNEEIESWLLRLLEPRLHFRFIEIDLDDKHLVLLEIPCAAHRPVSFQGTEFIRVGSYKKKLKDYQEKERALWRAFDNTPFEQQVAMAAIQATDVLGWLDYPSYFHLLELPLPESRDGILARLSDDGMIQQRQDGRWDILNLGAVLFARDLSQFKGLARKAVRVVIYKGDGRIQTIREQEGEKGYAVGFEGLIQFLKTVLPENETIGAALRKTVTAYPELAIRELVANLIIHQDFTLTGVGPMVEVFDHRIEITNPGKPLMDTNRLLDTPPRSRNEALASFFRRIGICEERGSGIDKVVFQTELYQLPAPIFEVVEGHTRVTLFAPKPFSQMNKEDRLRACYLHASLQYVQRKELTNSSLRKRFGIEKKNSAKVSRIIGEALEAGLITSSNPGSESKRHASYVPIWAI